jgi:anaerobic magnesium-protoporphyrin IX monomethyl ester cyclase
MKKTKYPKIALLQVSGEVDKYWEFYPPLGLVSVASYLTAYSKIPKENIIILDTSFPDYEDLILAFDPDVLGFSTFSNNYDYCVNVAKSLKQQGLKSLFVLGGVHISVFPDTLDSVFDIAVRKEGEETFLKIIKKWQKFIKKSEVSVFFDLKGIAYHGPDGVIANIDRPLLFPLDKIPKMDWSFFPNLFFRKEIVKETTNTWKSHKVAPIFTVRGCPYSCIFCARSALWKRVRFFSEERVVDEIEDLYRNFGVTAINIWDDVFTLNVPRLKKIEDLMRERNILGKVIFYWVFARSDLFTPEMAQQLKNLHVKSVAFGFESGSGRLLKLLKNDTTTPQNNKKAIELCEKEGINYVACIMMGIPTETKAEMKKTFIMVKKMFATAALQVIDLARATPFPGTELFDYSLKNGLIPKNYGTMSGSLSLNDPRMDKPLLIKNKNSVKAYRYYWNKIKKYENELINRNSKQKGFEDSKSDIKSFNNFNKKVFLPLFIFKYIKYSRINFIIRFILLKLLRFLKRVINKF